jgi:hypothetical protein
MLRFLLVTFLIGVFGMAEAQDNPWTARSDNVFQTLTISPPVELVIHSPDGRSAQINWAGEKVTFSGDLPLEEAAQRFFELYGQRFIEHRHKPQE